MKMVTAVIRHFKLDEVRAALGEIDIGGLTVSEVKGYGRQKGHNEVYRGAEYQTNFVPKLKIELVVSDEQLERVIAAISKNANTGKIFVWDINNVVRIRTGETGSAAI